MDEDGEWVTAFVMQVLRTGVMLHNVLCELLEDLPDEAFPGEEPGAVLIEMLTGTIRPVANAAGQPAVREATELLDAVGECVIEGLEGALALRRAMDRGVRTQG